ncbi:centrosomal protein kizuna [Colius striatus]|uniref:centrosomal protein kizuna n=1 Tax=Colius striatus TaxID=57412 RepID=UPI002B1E3EBF|nr:centrosomal protein kizuna [Colius striatus]
MPWFGSQAGINTKTAVPRRPCHPAADFMGHHTSAISPPTSLSTWQKHAQPTELCSPSPGELGPESRRADADSDAPVERAARDGHVAASEGGSQQLLSSASSPQAGGPEQQQRRGSSPGAKPCVSEWWSWEREDEPPVPASPEEHTPPGPGAAAPGASRERDGEAPAAQSPPLQPQCPPSEPSLSSALHRPHGTPEGLQLIEAAGQRVSPRHRALHGREQRTSPGRRHEQRTSPGHERGGPVTTDKLLRQQQQDVTVLGAPLSHHAVFLQRHQAQLPQDVAQMLQRLQVSSEKAQDSQGALPQKPGDRSSPQSHGSSCSLPSTPTDRGEAEQAERAPRLASAGQPGRDSDSDGSKAKASQEVPLETSSSSDERDRPVSRTEIRKGTVTAVKSKAFWGESDDSSSEIEAALRPQTHSTEADDFDDFYD